MAGLSGWEASLLPRRITLRQAHIIMKTCFDMLVMSFGRLVACKVFHTIVHPEATE